MSTLNSLTLNGKKYDSFKDKEAVKSINGTKPDENGNVNIEVSSGGITDTARILLMTVLKNAVYTSDQSANLGALEEALKEKSSGGNSGDSGNDNTGGDGGETEKATYTITNNLTNCTNSNKATTIEENASYSAVISATGGYELQSVVVTMGGTNVSVTGTVVNIPKVTGNIVITAVATATSTETVEEVLEPFWANSVDKTTLEYTTLDMSGGNPQTVYAQGTNHKQTETSGGVLHIDFDNTRASYLRLNIWLFDEQGNPYGYMYPNVAAVGGSAGTAISGDMTDYLTVKTIDGSRGNIWIKDSVTFNIPDGYRVLIVLDCPAEYILDEEMLSATKPLYALVTALTYDKEMLNVKVVKEV